MRFLISASLLFLILLAGCATIMLGTSRDISVNSNPSGAKVTVMGMEKGTTPAVIKVSCKDNNVIVKIHKDGYAPVEIALTRTMSGWAFGNIVFGGVIGLVVDFATGAIYNINPGMINADLKAIQSMNGESDYPKGFIQIQIVETD